MYFHIFPHFIFPSISTHFPISTQFLKAAFRPLLLLFAFLMLPAFLNAQFRAGDWLAHFEGLYGYSRLGEDEQRLYEYGLSGEFHFFPLSRLAFGAGFSTSYLSLDNDFFQAYDLGFRVEPQLRFYLLNDKWPLFLQAAYSWQQAELGRPFTGGEKQTAQGSGASAGAGANFSLAPAISLEALILYRYDKAERLLIQPQEVFRRGLYARAGLRLQLSSSGDPSPSWQGPGEEAVGASAWLLGGNIGGGINFGNPDTYSLSLQGGHFLARRFALGIGLQLERVTNEGFGEPGLSSGVEPFLRYYLPLSNSMLAFPTAGFQWGRSEELDNFNLEGFRFRTWQLGMGVDFFLSRAAALELILNLSGRSVSPGINAVPRRSFDVAFSLSVGLMTFWFE